MKDLFSKLPLKVFIFIPNLFKKIRNVIFGWCNHFIKSISSDNGYLVLGSIIGIYVAYFSLVEAKHDRSRAIASNELNVFFSMVSTGNKQSFIPAMKNFGRVQSINVVVEPSLFEPSKWWNEIQPNKEVMRQWAEVALPMCTRSFCGHVPNKEFKYSYDLDLRQANLSNVDLSGITLERVNISGGSFYQANLIETNLSYGNLSFTQNQHANMQGANFKESIIHDANMAWVDFSPSMSDDNFGISTNFSGANLQNTDFYQSDLSGANFESADIRGVNFTSANLTHANMSKAKYNLRTKFPKGFKLTGKGLILLQKNSISEPERK